MQKNMRIPLTLVSLILISLFLGNASSSLSGDLELTENLNINTNQKHFVLVHGPCFGAWSWYKLIPLLRSYGHKVTAIDLAASGISPIQLSQVLTLSDYTKPLLDLMASINGKVILVGHSYGGLAISQAMEHFSIKISVAIFLNAVMPGPNLPISDIVPRGVSVFATALDNQISNTSFIFGPQYLSQVVFRLSPRQDVELANALVRPLPALPNTTVLAFSPDKYGSVKRIYITSEQDQVTPIELQEYMIQKNPPNRVERIVGSDHMVMISQTTQLLFKLMSIAVQFP